MELTIPPWTESRYNLNGHSRLASCNKTKQIGCFFGHVGFRLEKNVCLPMQLGACNHLTGRLTVPYWCTIDVRTPWAFHGVPTGPLEPCRAPTAAWRPAGGSVRLIFIGGPRFGRPAAPLGAGAIVYPKTVRPISGGLSLATRRKCCNPRCMNTIRTTSTTWRSNK